MLRAFAIFSTALLLSVCACAQKENERGAPKVEVQLPYVIGAGDRLIVSVGKEYVSVGEELDLTNSLTVRADGMISIPSLNDVQAAGLTPMQLAASITEKLKKDIADPHVLVIVTQMAHGRVRLAPNFSLGGIIRDLEDSPQGPIIGPF